MTEERESDKVVKVASFGDVERGRIGSRDRYVTTFVATPRANFMGPH